MTPSQDFILLTRLPCGCAFPERKAKILLWLLNWKRCWRLKNWLFDLIHGPEPSNLKGDSGGNE